MQHWRRDLESHGYHEVALGEFLEDESSRGVKGPEFDSIAAVPISDGKPVVGLSRPGERLARPTFEPPSLDFPERPDSSNRASWR